jgi:hypothetical protein
MVTTNGTVGEVVEGVIESANDRGIKVGGEWRNQSKFHPVDLDKAERGARVRLELDNKGFIRTLQVLEPTGATDNLSRDRTITRLAVLKAAANFLGQLSQTREEVRSEHVLTLADKWVAWVDQATTKEAF